MSADPRPTADARLLALEERLTFQERLVEELNEIVLRQQGELDTLRGEVAAQRAAFDRLSRRGSGDDLPYEKPPHY